ncbi:helix-turn-helix transcriptional regulator [Neobacillus rhizosphaerae]|uniref:helix-turn-helix domain-containing protein n=1 Tax=Neobacillus rhizosphaerae TaxID=2880965 RepID=UPI003D2A229D
MTNVGEKLKKIREDKGFSPLDLEAISGVNRTTISRIENNLQSPTVKTLLKLCKSLHTSINDLFEDSENKQDCEDVQDNESIGSSEDKSEEMINLVETAKKLTPNQKQKITEMIESFITEK